MGKNPRMDGRLTWLVVPVAITIAFFAIVGGISGVSAQQTQLVYGNNSGTIRPVAVDSTGKILVSATADPCLDPNVAKTSVSVAIGSATTTQLVALSGTTTVYVCGFAVTLTGTAPTLQFEYGTGASCGTGTTVLTGTFAPTTGSFLYGSVDGTEIKTIAANALCAVTTGTGPSIQGVVTYVQQ